MGCFLWGFSNFWWIEEKFVGEIVSNEALDTNMLRGNLGDGPIFHESLEIEAE